MVGCTGATVIQEGIFRIINAAGILLAAEWGYVLATTVEGGAERSGWWTPWGTHQLRPPFLIIRSMDGDRAPPLHSIVGVQMCGSMSRVHAAVFPQQRTWGGKSSQVAKVWNFCRKEA
ncbi:hypothetical protein BHE74_00027434 [Ensete ventricosum]|nr:hypothetical protein BHE74_00027434 [Ensete ventricosum]